jgi:methionine sulfoxide reductase heme-binding subunit
VSIPVVSVIIPFTSGYEGFWLGLGAISLDIMAALIITSLVRSHLSRGLWRAVHWLAYLSWPVAFAHSLGSSRDLQRGPLLLLAICCALAVVAAVIWRLAAAAREIPRAERVSALMPGYGRSTVADGRGVARRGGHGTSRGPRRGTGRDTGPRNPSAVSARAEITE